MFIELPHTSAATTAEPFPDLEEVFDAPQTVTADRAAAACRVRAAPARAVPRRTASISVQGGDGFAGTFTQG